MKKRTRFYYYLFDWANSPYSTVIITFIFSSYFVNTIANSKISGTSIWGWTIALSGVCIAIAGPILGYIADSSKKFAKYFITLSTLIISIGSCMLWFSKPEASFLIYTLIIIFITNSLFELSQVFYNAKLLEFKKNKLLGQFSGTAWACGYLGGIACLVLILSLIVLPEKNFLNLSKEEYEHIRFCGVIVGLWYLLFAFPFLINFKIKENLSKNISVKDFLPDFISTFKNKNNFKFLLARMFYTDGLITLFSFGGIYASGTFEFTFSEIIYFGIAINITAAVGSFLFGFVEDKFGIKNTITISLTFLIVICITILIIESKILFWLLGTSIGFFIGAIQSSSRTALIFLSNGKNLNKMFGIYAVSGKITNFLGPISVAFFTVIFESQRAGMSSILIFSVIGLAILINTKFN